MAANAVGNLMSLVLRHWYREVEAGLAGSPYEDLTAGQSIVWENLSRNQTRQSELAERAQVSKQAIAQVVGSLESAGYLERTADPVDRRAALVSLTPEGRQAARAAREVMAEVEEAWAAAVGPERMRQMREALTVLAGQNGWRH